jgi:hypothetical protein
VKEKKMNAWTESTYDAALVASNGLANLAVELNDALGAGGGATSPDDVLRYLRQITSLAASMSLTVSGGKIKALLDHCEKGGAA